MENNYISIPTSKRENKSLSIKRHIDPKDTALIFPIKLSILHKSASQRSVSLLNKVDHKSSNRDILHHDSRRLVGFIIKSFLTRRGAGFARDKETWGQGDKRTRRTSVEGLAHKKRGSTLSTKKTFRAPKSRFLIDLTMFLVQNVF